MSEHLYSQPGMVPHWSLNTVPNLIGLSGWARSGKDTVADAITEVYGHKKVSFATPLKQMAYAINPIVRVGLATERLQDVVNYMGWEKAKNIHEVRRFLQHLGTEARHHIGADVWVDAAFQDIHTGKRYVISDVRFKNEALAIQQVGGVLLRVDRPGVEAPNDHVSEHDLDDWDFDARVHNDGTLEDLGGTVILTLAGLG